MGEGVKQRLTTSEWEGVSELTCFACLTRWQRAVLPPSVGVHGEAVDPLPPPPGVPAVVVLAHVRLPMAVGLRGRPRLAGEVSRRGVHGAHVVLPPGRLLLAPRPCAPGGGGCRGEEAEAYREDPDEARGPNHGQGLGKGSGPD